MIAMEKNLLANSTATTKIMYIGPKAIKEDTVSGYYPKIKFKRNQPTEVPLIVASSLLSFDCFVQVDEDSIEQVKRSQEAEAEALKKEQEQAELLKQQELDAADTVVVVDDADIDLGKLTFGALDAFIEANELNIRREDGEPKELFCLRVRDAYRAKSTKE